MLPGIQKGQHAGPAVAPHRGGGAHGGRRQCVGGQADGRGSGDSQDREGEHGEQHGGAQVRLQHDERGKPGQHHHHRTYRAHRVAHLVPPTGQQVGREDDQSDLGQLRRLKLEEPDAEPAAGPVDGDRQRVAGNGDQKQQPKRSRQQRGCQVPQTSMIEPRHHPHGHGTQANKHGLTGKEPVGRPADVERFHRRRREHHHQTHAAQARHQRHQQHGGRSHRVGRPWQVGTTHRSFRPARARRAGGPRSTRPPGARRPCARRRTA